VDNHPSGLDVGPDEAPAAGTLVEIRIGDSGSGIPEDVRDRIFDPFFTTKPPEKGSGLGLSMVRSILADHGGSIDFETEPGRGTTFTIHLPLAEPAGGGQRALPRGLGQRILVVDDEASVLSLIEQTLTDCGYRVVTAQDGVGGLSRYTEYQGDLRLVIVDMKLPIMDGLGLIQSIRRIDPAIPILAISGQGILDAEAREAVTAFLAKPFDTGQILDEVERLLGD
jgi:CheY-like chemotaxis protein